MKNVKVIYSGKHVSNYKANTAWEAKAYAERGGHLVDRVVEDGEAITVYSKRHPGLVKISDEEFDRVIAAKKKSGVPFFNGCTSVWLAEEYGSEFAGHISGVGFFRRRILDDHEAS